MPKLLVHKRAARYLQRMDAQIKAQLVAKLGELAQNPDVMPGVKPMARSGPDTSDCATATCG